MLISNRKACNSISSLKTRNDVQCFLMFMLVFIFHPDIFSRTKSAFKISCPTQSHRSCNIKSPQFTELALSELSFKKQVCFLSSRKVQKYTKRQNEQQIHLDRCSSCRGTVSVFTQWYWHYVLCYIIEQLPPPLHSCQTHG